MTIADIKNIMNMTNRYSIIAFPNKPLPCIAPIHYMFDNSGRILSTIDEINDLVGESIMININNIIHIKPNIQCMLINNHMFDKNELECTFAGCSVLLNTEDDIFNIDEIHLYELNRIYGKIQ